MIILGQKLCNIKYSRISLTQLEQNNRSNLMEIHVMRF